VRILATLVDRMLGRGRTTVPNSREALTKYVVERMAEARETGKPVEFEEWYRMASRKGGKV
jgi:hypothetical protein